MGFMGGSIDSPDRPEQELSAGLAAAARAAHFVRHAVLAALHGWVRIRHGVEFRRAIGSGLDLVQKFPQVHFSHPPWADGSELYSKLLSVVLYQTAETLTHPRRVLAAVV